MRHYSGNRRYGTPNGDSITAVMDPKRGQLVGSNGELNAYNKKDSMQAITSLQSAVKNGNVVQSDVRSNIQVMEDRRNDLVEAYSDQTGQKWAALGQVVADEIWETMGQFHGPIAG